LDNERRLVVAHTVHVYDEIEIGRELFGNALVVGLHANLEEFTRLIQCWKTSRASTHLVEFLSFAIQRRFERQHSRMLVDVEGFIIAEKVRLEAIFNESVESNVFILSVNLSDNLADSCVLSKKKFFEHEIGLRDFAISRTSGTRIV
jgi:hypothetical protein